MAQHPRKKLYDFSTFFLQQQRPPHSIFRKIDVCSCHCRKWRFQQSSSLSQLDPQKMPKIDWILWRNITQRTALENNFLFGHPPQRHFSKILRILITPVILYLFAKPPSSRFTRAGYHKFRGSGKN